MELPAIPRLPAYGRVAEDFPNRENFLKSRIC
jgi:hypothetical protein